MEIKPVRYFVTDNCSISGVGRNGKPYRKQRVFARNGEEVTKLEFMLDDKDPFLVPGDYALAPDAVYIAQEVREYNGRNYAEPALRVSPRFVKVPVAAVSAPKAA